MPSSGNINNCKNGTRSNVRAPFEEQNPNYLQSRGFRFILGVLEHLLEALKEFSIVQRLEHDNVRRADNMEGTACTQLKIYIFSIFILLTALGGFILSLLPWGFVETKGTTPKYPEVRMFSCKMSSRMFLLQSSPSQFLHVALFLAAEV